MKGKRYLTLLLTILCSQVIGQFTWTTPTTISALGSNATEPHIGIDASGNAVAAWIEGTVVKAKRLPIGGSWTSASTLSGSGATSLRLIMDRNGNSAAIWLEGGVVRASSQASGGSWSAATSLSGSGTATSPAMNVDTTGNVVAVWVQTSTLSVVSLQSSTKLNGGNWQAIPDTISGSTSTPSSPSVSIGANGTVVAVWHAVSGTNDTINSAIKTISGGVWGTPLAFFAANATFKHNYPKVIVDANGNAHAVWWRFSQTGTTYSSAQLIASQLPLGSPSWALASILSPTPSLKNPANLPTRLQVDSIGNVVAFWVSSYDGQTYNVEASSRLFGGNWSSFSQIISPFNLYGFDADCSVSSAGDALGVFMAYDGSSINIQDVHSSIANPFFLTWSTPETISQGARNSTPRVASSLANTTINACAVWLNDNGSNNVIQASTATGSAVLPPSGLMVSQSSNGFGVFTDYYNTITWTASADPNIYLYLIYRNGFYIGAVDAGTLQFVDHNAIQSGAVTYGVTAYTFDNTQSAIVNVSFP